MKNENNEKLTTMEMILLPISFVLILFMGYFTFNFSKGIADDYSDSTLIEEIVDIPDELNLLVFSAGGKVYKNSVEVNGETYQIEDVIIINSGESHMKLSTYKLSPLSDEVREAIVYLSLE